MIESNQGVIGHNFGQTQFPRNHLHDQPHHHHHNDNIYSSSQSNHSMILSLLLNNNNNNNNNNTSTISPLLLINYTNIITDQQTNIMRMMINNNQNNHNDDNNQILINDDINNNQIDNNDNLCQLHAPVEMLDEWKQLLFGSSIFITAIITFLLNLFVIITLIINRYCNFDQSGSRQNSLSTTTTIPAAAAAAATATNNNKQMISNDTIVVHRVSSISSSKSSTTTIKSFSHTQQSFISLSISVILYSSICVPAMYLETIEQLPTTCSNCFIITSLRFGFYVAPIASSFMHLLMAFDRYVLRYLAIKQCYLFQSYWYRRHYTFCIVLVWIASTLIIIPFFWYHKFGRTMQILLTLMRLMLTFSIPSLLTLYLYLSIACELKRVASTTIIVTPFITNNRLILKHREIIAKIILLALIHFLCWFPFSVMESLNDLFPDLFSQCNFQLQTYYCTMAILILFTSMSGIAYPILYCFVSSEFRKIFSQKLTIFSFFTY
uniref:Bromodomain and WD repeat-containing DDB_G0285837-like n=1 Tax=Dermatophagoides pteronyssinus TaxID=6956 RepID=A0A6P6YGX6_DERPT|nr:bromodomain and WD repeat-containing DDB_G0285837-like [Dermatophagoides pteronyssinus]